MKRAKHALRSLVTETVIVSMFVLTAIDRRWGAPGRWS